MIKASIACLVFLWTTLQVTTAAAQQTRVISFDEQFAWGAVGRITNKEYDGASGCTAALVQPDLILTAGHCLGSLTEATIERIAQTRFFAGLNDGKILAQSSLAEVIVSPDYIRGKLNVDRIPTDWALAKLASPITTIPPLPIVSLPGEWEPVSFLAYSRTHRTSPVLSSNCAQEKFQDGIMLIECPVFGGNSGAPVLVGSPPNLQIAGVISAKADNFAFAVIPDEELLSHISPQD